MPEQISSIAQNDFDTHIAQELVNGQREVVEFTRSVNPVDERAEESYSRAREIVKTERPVPQIIWRICSYTVGRANNVNKLSEGMLFGLKRLAMAIGKDPTLRGGRSNLSSVREVVDVVPSDLIAACAVMHAVCRRLQTKDLQSVWGPVLEDALLRAQIGFFAGAMSDTFGSGRAMFAGFAGRVGLAVLIAHGSAEQAASAMKGLAAGRHVDEITLEIYGAASLHVAGMVLLAAGCGRDALIGIGAFGMSKAHQKLMHPDARQWLAAFSIIENLRAETSETISQELWASLGLQAESSQKELKETVATLMSTGHRWEWLF
jgi:hypothetical protein